MSLVALALIGPQNDPIYFKSYQSYPPQPQTSQDHHQDNTKFQFIVHSALDAIEAKSAATGSPAGGDNNASPSRSALPLGFLGFLLPIDSYRIYAYNGLGVLVIGVTTESSHPSGTVSPSMSSHHVYSRLLHGLFYRAYRLYLTALCNPFHHVVMEAIHEPVEGEITDFVKGEVEAEGGIWRPKFQRGTDYIVGEFNRTLLTL